MPLEEKRGVFTDHTIIYGEDDNGYISLKLSPEEYKYIQDSLHNIYTKRLYMRGYNNPTKSAPGRVKRSYVLATLFQ